ncbi:MAG TPA: phage tail sheath C-terminal domain-containing protein [Anaerolineae bacterium]
MPEYVTPGVYFEVVDHSIETVPPTRTDIAAFIGIAERGPVHAPLRLRSWQQFQSVFGNFIADGYLAYCVKAFFDNGGDICFGVRVAAPSVRTQTSGVQPVDGSASVVSSADGLSDGAVVTLSQTVTTTTTGAQPLDRLSSRVVDVSHFAQDALVQLAQAGLLEYRRVLAVDDATQELRWDSAIPAGFDLTQPVQFSADYQVDRLIYAVSGTTVTWDTPLPVYLDLSHPIAASSGMAVAQGALLDQTYQPTLIVSAANPGVWGDALRVHVTHLSAAATRTRAMPQPADRLSSYVDTITGFERGALVSIRQDGVPQTAYRLVTRVDPSRRRLEWHAALGAAFNLPDVQSGVRPLSIETLEFGLSVYDAGQLRETFDRLSLVSDHSRYIANVITSDTSRLITVADVASSPISIASVQGGAPLTLPMRLPRTDAPNLMLGQLALHGGRDGIAALEVDDFIGGADDERGLRTLEDVSDVRIVAMPDVLIQPALPIIYQPQPAPPVNVCLPQAPVAPLAEPPAPPLLERAPHFDMESVALAQQALVDQCERLHDRFALLDPPVTPRGIADADEIQMWRQRFDSSYAALYYPWVLVLDPLRLGNSPVRAIPPCGHVAGVYAQTDLERGVHHAPANVELAWAQALTFDISGDLQGALNPIGINCLRVLPGRGIRVYAARTLSSIPMWRYVNVRRLLMMIEKSIEQAIQWSVFEPNSTDLRNTLVSSISNFLETLWLRGALFGVAPEQAFVVQCDDDNNPPYLADLGQLVVDVGVAPVSPAEFVVVRIGKTADTLEITELNGAVAGDTAGGAA